MRSRLISLVTMVLMTLTLMPISPAYAVVTKSGVKQCGYDQTVRIRWNGSGTVKVYAPAVGGTAHTVWTFDDIGNGTYNIGSQRTSWKVTSTGYLADFGTYAICQ